MKKIINYLSWGDFTIDLLQKIDHIKDENVKSIEKRKWSEYLVCEFTKKEFPLIAFNGPYLTFHMVDKNVEYHDFSDEFKEVFERIYPECLI